MTEQNMMNKSVLFFISFIFISLSFADSSYAEQRNQGLIQCPAYGFYWRSYKGGWYGARREVKTPGEANEILLQFYVPQKGIRIHRIIEGPDFYRAEILNQKGALIDMVIIDKRTGRIRSIY